jgi:hypothetical protein
MDRMIPDVEIDRDQNVIYIVIITGRKGIVPGCRALSPLGRIRTFQKDLHKEALL